VPVQMSELLLMLSRPPRRGWPDGVVHHGLRVGLLLGMAILLQVLFPVAQVPDFPTYERGMVPSQDMIAEVGFPIPKTDAELAQEREEAASAVAPVFRYDPTALDTMLSRVSRFMAHADSAARGGQTELERRSRMRDLLVAYGFPVDEDALDVLTVQQHRNQLNAALQRTINAQLPDGIASSSDYEDSPAQQWRLLREGSERLVPRDSVPTQSALFARASQYLPSASPAGMADFQRLVLILFFEPTLRLDRARTDAAREQARQAVPTMKGEVLRGERVVAAHEQIRDREIERLNAYRAFLQETGALGEGRRQWGPELGTFILNLLALSILGFLLYFYRPEVYRNVRHVVLLALLTAVLCGAATAISRTGAPVELVPIAFPVLIVAALWDGRLALTFAIVLATLLSIQTDFMGPTPRLLMLLGGSAAALSVRVVQRRSQGLVLGAVIALVYAVTSVALGLVRSREMSDVLVAILYGTANGMASALLAFGFMPLFESFTRITTDQTLLELADLNRPLLKRLSLEASGTYAHSINVANLAEAAARGIGANPLLVRVGAYYHDVGKMALPQYFIENQARGRNPHDHIDPRKSAAIVRGHVTEGMKMAEQAKLPDTVKVFIPEHHGTQSIGFFYDQARQANPEAELDASDFSYYGPKPKSRETAILMLADSVESAAKVLQEPTPDRIRALVDRIVEGKISQGQLDDAPLTLADVARIKEQFAGVLTGMYHHRIDYPPAAARSAEAAGAPSPGSPSPGVRT
jgi:cyclic-di-AMP phosphodiesterase PgpH